MTPLEVIGWAAAIPFAMASAVIVLLGMFALLGIVLSFFEKDGEK